RRQRSHRGSPGSRASDALTASHSVILIRKIVLDQHPTASPEKSEMWGEPSSPSYIFNSPIFLYLLSYF
ncbi:unnamed protein product, partial [Trichogramma brassicae]